MTVASFDLLPHVAPGGHVCWGYHGHDELVEVAAQFLAGAPAFEQQSVFIGPGEVIREYGAPDSFDASAQIEGFRRQATAARSAGYTGLRVVADCTAMVRDASVRDSFASYEHLVDRFLHHTRLVTGLCCYDVEAIGDDAVDELAVLHPLSSSSVPFHVSSAESPDDLVLTGELDRASLPMLARALRRLTTTPGALVAIDIAELSFVDHSTLLVVDAFADRFGGRILLRRARPVVAWLVHQLDLRHVEVEPG